MARVSSLLTGGIMYMNYLLDITAMKKPKWYQLTTILKNRRIISKAKFYVETMSNIGPVTQFIDNCCDFMSVIDFLRKSGYGDDILIPNQMKNKVKFSSSDQNDYLTMDFFSIEVAINGYDITMYLKRYDKSNFDIRDISIYYISKNNSINQTLNLGSIYNRDVYELYGEPRLIIDLVSDFIKTTLLHIIKNLIYIYQ